jgi:hypothetical protein
LVCCPKLRCNDHRTSRTQHLSLIRIHLLR